MRISEAAPAKLNLALHVTRRRDDGYHDLESLVVFADVGDELSAEPAPADTLAIRGPFAQRLGTSDGNLVMRAVAAFRARFPTHVATGLKFTLEKNLPIAAGLGGGSADAAAALRLMAVLGEPDIAPRDLVAIAATLGADVPACLLSMPATIRGVGEIVTPLRAFPAVHVVLINPLLPLATAEVFRRLLIHDNEPLPPLPEPMTRPAQLGIWLAETRNDLETPAIAMLPEIAALIERMARAGGCMLARMSGSGATVFGVFGSAALAHQAAHELRAEWPDHWVAAAPLVNQ
ncbi:MAG: 4-(cytidine 5-diphospho)-2-C-methyl-D-erythritol kinase [Devosia sp.]|nr:4-(cytidine 5-diphospho)-2-C-methyl-D-erythritol kinase [Devosia sp.]